jgi:hypothetical protein
MQEDLMMRTLQRTLTALAAMAVAATVSAPELQGFQTPEAQEQHEQARDSILGQVVEANHDELRVRADDGRALTFKVDENTRLTDPATRLDDDEARDKIEDLEAGEKVKVHFRTGDTPQERIALSVEIRDEATPGLREPAQRRTEQQQERTEQQPGEDRVEGQVVQASEDELRLTARDGRTMTFKIDENTRVMDPAARYDDTTARERVDALRAGESVAVRFRTGDTPNERIAMAIELRGTDAAARAERAVEPTTQPREELPRTSSNLPLLAVLGVVGIIGATGVAAWGRKRGHVAG